jgi:pimeloyl-ACP methyl ester carboxylesterase
MTNLSSDSRIELIEDTGHCIPCDQPQIVIDAVLEVVQAA